jgi:hypothetical protein
MEQALIRWLRLKETCEAILAEHHFELQVFLHLSSDVPDDYKALVQRKGDEVNILLNMKYNKGLDDVIRSIAHELAHVVADSSGHKNIFRPLWRRLERRLWAGYGEED